MIALNVNAPLSNTAATAVVNDPAALAGRVQDTAGKPQADAGESAVVSLQGRQRADAASASVASIGSSADAMAAALDIAALLGGAGMGAQANINGFDAARLLAD